MYSEAQIGLLVGGSAGYVREFEAGKKSTGGFIGSLWVAAYLGVDVRILQINGQEYVAPGLFYKYMAIPQNININ